MNMVSVTAKPEKDEKMIKKVIPKLGMITANIMYIIANGFNCEPYLLIATLCSSERF